MAAAAVSAVVISMGAVAPVYAAGNGGHGNAHASQVHASQASAHQSQGRSHAKSTSGQDESESGDQQDTKGQPESKSQPETKSQSQAEGKSHAKVEGDNESSQQGEDQESGSQEEQARTKTSESHRSTAASSGDEEKAGAPASSQGKGHTPVTVCHLLGNGGYHLLTFDQHALKAHLAHGDVYPDSTGACPSAPSSSAATTTKAHGHTPVTVCHLLGNGGYHLLTFDQHALKAHLAHGDVYPTDGTCPAPESMIKGSSTTTDTEVTKTTVSKTETSEAASSVATRLSTVPTRILGVQAARGPRVLGVEAFRAGTATTSAGTTPSAQIAPAAGLLPNTGAARIGLPLVAGFGLLAAGVGLLLRRRGATRG